MTQLDERALLAKAKVTAMCITVAVLILLGALICLAAKGLA